MYKLKMDAVTTRHLAASQVRLAANNVSVHIAQCMHLSVQLYLCKCTTIPVFSSELVTTPCCSQTLMPIPDMHVRVCTCLLVLLFLHTIMGALHA